jgi:H+/gluconate symporter-like permease
LKRTPEFSDRGGDILTGALVASASAVIAGAVYVVGWVWSEKYGERKAIEDELSEDESEEAIEAEEEEAEEEEKEEEDEDEEDVEENKASQIKKRGIRIHARHRTPEALTPTHWRE